MRCSLLSPVRLSVAFIVAAGLLAGRSLAADETCAQCDKNIVFSGDFVHQRVPGRVAITGAPAGMEDAFRTSIAGSNFVATITGLPEGRYTIIIGEVEASSDNLTNAGQRVFDVLTSGDTVLAKDYEILTAAGGPDKVTFIKGTIDHQIDSVSGPVVVGFRAHAGLAKVNSFEVRDPATDTSVLYVRAVDLMDQLDALALAAPEVPGPALWKDPTQPTAVRVGDLVNRMSLAEKAAQMGNTAPRIPRLGIPAYNYWSEALHGVARVSGRPMTVFPQAIGNGATWDVPLVKQMAHVIGVEGRANNNLVRARPAGAGASPQFSGLTFWSPNINIFRDPRWGRGQETYGEDTFLTSRMGVAFIQGMQGDDPKYLLVMACAKHFAVHSGPEALRHRFDVYPSERDLYETYLPHFEAAVREGHVGQFMSAYNAVDGEPAPSSTFLLTDILRKRWGFDGFVVSDCDAVADIWQNHLTVHNAVEAAARAVKGGTDLCCGRTYGSLVAAVRSNLIGTNDIDTALGRVLEGRFRLGMFDPSNMVPYDSLGTNDIDTPEHRELALQLARESMVLLKNDGILPLDRSRIKHIAVIGPNAAVVPMLYANYNGTPSSSVTLLDGLKAVAGPNIEVTFAQGSPIAPIPVVTNTGRGGFGGYAAPPAPTTPESLARQLHEALAAASNADVIIFVGGINSSLEGEEGTRSPVEGFSNGDRTRIELPQVQENVMKALAATGKPVIFVNCSGCAMAFPWEAGHLPAILQAWYPGEEGGTAVGEVLFGDYNPAGRLPVTFYRTTADLPAFTNYSMENRTYRYFTGVPLYAFGHGLSYTHFDYSRPRVSKAQVRAGDALTVTFTVANRGARDGDEVAQVYFRHLNSAVPQPFEALCAFTRVKIAHGSTTQVSLDIPVERLRYWDTTKEDYTVEAGKYELMIGAASDDIRQRVAFSVVR